MANPSACLLLLNDLHVSKDNIPEFSANWREALDICRMRSITQIALGGDLFLSRTAQTLDVLLAVRGALLEAAEAGIRVTLAEGNHDLVDQEAILGYCHVFDQHANVTVVDDFLTLADPAWDFVLHMMSYFPENGSFTSKLKALCAGSLKAGKLNCLYIHEGIRGALAQPSETELPAVLFKDFDRTFVGHYHNRMVIKNTEIEYIGSSRQHNFGEDEAKGYTVLYTDGQHEFIQNKANIRYRVIDVQAEKVNVHLTDLLDENRGNDRCRIKVRVHGDQARLSSVDKKKLYQAGAAKVELSPPTPRPSRRPKPECSKSSTAARSASLTKIFVPRSRSKTLRWDCRTSKKSKCHVETDLYRGTEPLFLPPGGVHPRAGRRYANFRP